MASPVKFWNSIQTSTSEDLPSGTMVSHLLISSEQHVKNAGDINCRRRKSQRAMRQKKRRNSTFSLSIWKARLTIFLCLAHFSPSWAIVPATRNLVKGLSLDLPMLPDFSERISLASWGSLMTTRGRGPSQVKKNLPEWERKRKT